MGAGAILSQQVTLGESRDPESGVTGAPTLEENVHVGPGARLLGPITVGAGSKVMPNAVLMQSVPPGSLVETPLAQPRPRKGRGPAAVKQGA